MEGVRKSWHLLNDHLWMNHLKVKKLRLNEGMCPVWGPTASGSGRWAGGGYCVPGWLSGACHFQCTILCSFSPEPDRMSAAWDSCLGRQLSYRDQDG